MTKDQLIAFEQKVAEKKKPWLRPRYLEWRKEYEKTSKFREAKRVYFARRRKDPVYRRKQSEYQRNWKLNNWLRRLALMADRRAKKKGIESDREYLLSLKEISNCESCGSFFDHGIAKKKYRALDQCATLDRIDSSKGYIRGNVGIICWRCNRIKSDATRETLRAIIAYMEKSGC